MSIFEIHSFLGLDGYYRRFENGLNIERKIEDARSTQDAGVGSKREDQPSSSSRKRQKTSASHEFQD